MPGTIKRKRSSPKVTARPIRKADRGAGKIGPVERRLHESLGFSVSGRSHESDVRSLRESIGFSQEEWGRLVGYSTRAVAGWEAGKPTESARRKLNEIRRLLRALAELMPSEHVGPWLRRANESFQSRTPMNLIESGESDQIWQMIHQIDANVAN